MPKTPNIQGKGIAFADPLVRNRFYNNILTMCRRWREEIKGLKRNPIFHMQSPTIEQRRMLSLKFGGIRISVTRTIEQLDMMESQGTKVPDNIRKPVAIIDTELKGILNRLSPPDENP